MNGPLKGGKSVGLLDSRAPRDPGCRDAGIRGRRQRRRVGVGRLIRGAEESRNRRAGWTDSSWQTPPRQRVVRRLRTDARGGRPGRAAPRGGSRVTADIRFHVLLSLAGRCRPRRDAVDGGPPPRPLRSRGIAGVPRIDRRGVVPCPCHAHSSRDFASCMADGQRYVLSASSNGQSIQRCSMPASRNRPPRGTYPRRAKKPAVCAGAASVTPA